MIQRKWEEADISKAFFKVDTQPVFWTDIYGRKQKLSNQKVLVNAATQKPLSVVSDSYQLITNRDAVQMADYAIKQVFPGKTLDDFKCFNVYMPQTSTSCRIDLIIPQSYSSPFGDHTDNWTPFVRISNSYNKSITLRYEIGFCRWICLNGVIFDKHKINISVIHNRNYWNEVRHQIRSQQQIQGISTLWSHFEKKMQILRATAIPQSMALPMFCRAFGVTLAKEQQPREERQPTLFDMTDMQEVHPEPGLTLVQKDNLRKKAQRIIHDAQEYFTEMGNNAYALFNVLSDYASYPECIPGSSTYIHGYQRKVGDWVDEIIEAVGKTDFSLYDFIGKEAMDTAFFLESLA